MQTIRHIDYEDKVVQGTPGAIEGVTDTMRAEDANTVKHVVNDNADALAEQYADYLYKVLQSIKPTIKLSKDVFAKSESIEFNVDPDLQMQGEILPILVDAAVYMYVNNALIASKAITSSLPAIDAFSAPLASAKQFSQGVVNCMLRFEMHVKLTDAHPSVTYNSLASFAITTNGLVIADTDLLTITPQVTDTVYNGVVKDTVNNLQVNGAVVEHMTILSNDAVKKITDSNGFDITDLFALVSGNVRYDNQRVAYAYRAVQTMYNISNVNIEC